MWKLFPQIKLVQKQDFELGTKELLTCSQVKRVVLERKEGEPSEESDAENYCLCHLYMRKIVENHDYLEVWEYKTVEIEMKSQ